MKGYLLVIFAFAALWTSSVAFFKVSEPRLNSLKHEGRKGTLRTLLIRESNFNVQQHNRFELRYYENDEFYVGGGPIFIMVGGPWTISPAFVEKGLMYDMAKALNGTMYYVEHRYYGDSFPVPDASLSNMRFLSVDQTLGDLANFITQTKASLPGGNEAPVFLVGGSLAGSIATYFRIQYNHVVQGVWASSAPITAHLNFDQYLELLGMSLRQMGGNLCYDEFDAVFTAIEEMLVANETDELEQLFNLCEPLDTGNRLDVASFMLLLVEQIALMVENHKFVEIQGMCFAVQMGSSPLLGFANFFGLMTGNRCQYHSYEKRVASYSLTDFAVLSNTRQFAYQICAQLGWFPTSDSPNQPFGNRFPVDVFHTFCNDVFQNAFSNGILESNIVRLNGVFGGKQPAVSKVIFTHGELDPFRSLGVQSDLNDESPVIVIPRASHASDMDSIGEDDWPELVEAKEMVRDTIFRWYNEFVAENGARK